MSCSYQPHAVLHFYVFYLFLFMKQHQKRSRQAWSSLLTVMHECNANQHDLNTYKYYKYYLTVYTGCLFVCFFLL